MDEDFELLLLFSYIFESFAVEVVATPEERSNDPLEMISFIRMHSPELDIIFVL